MRLAHVPEVIYANLEKYHPAVERRANDNTNIRVTNMTWLRTATTALSEIRPLARRADTILKLLDGKPQGDEAYFEEKELKSLEGHISSLNQHARLVADALKDLVGPEVPLEFAIRLPTGIVTLSGLADAVGRYKNLDNLTRRITEDGITLKGVDSGSSWLVFFVMTPVVVKAVAMIWSAAMNAVRQLQEVEMASQRLQAARGIQQSLVDLTEERIRLHKFHSNLLKEQLANKVLNGEAVDAESSTLIEAVVKGLMDDIERDAHLVLSLTAPPEVRADIPPSMLAPAARKSLASPPKALEPSTQANPESTSATEP